MGDLTEEHFEALSALASRAQAGEADAYNELLHRLYPFIQSVIRSKLGAVVEVDDVTQECLLGVHKSLSSYHPSRRFKPWIWAIVRYKIADHFRAAARKKEYEYVESIHDVTNDGLDANTKAGIREPEATRGIDVSELVQALPAKLRNAVVLTKLKGLTCEEAARREGVSNAALRKRISRAYQKLAGAAAREMEKETGH